MEGQLPHTGKGEGDVSSLYLISSRILQSQSINIIITYLTGIPAVLMAVAVPPDAIKLNPRPESFCANSTNPVLSDTLRIAGKTNIQDF